MWIQKVPGGGVTALAYSTDGGTLYTCDAGSWVTAWDVAARTGRRLHRADRWIFHGLRPLADGRLIIHNIPLIACRPDTGAIETLAAPAGFDDSRIPLITPGGRVYALNPDQRTVGVWDINTGRVTPRHGPWVGSLVGFDVTPDERLDRRDRHPWPGRRRRAGERHRHGTIPAAVPHRRRTPRTRCASPRTATR